MASRQITRLTLLSRPRTPSTKRLFSIARTCGNIPSTSICTPVPRTSVFGSRDLGPGNTGSLRFYSSDTKPVEIPQWDFEKINTFLDNPSPKTLLIDVREPAELAESGTIPTALPVPIVTQPDSFHIPAEEFVDRFGYERPAKDVALVCFCKAGVRAQAAAQLARDAGWADVSVYSGSWLDWVKRGGRIQK